MPTLCLPIDLVVPGALAGAFYEKVRSDPILGQALDGAMIPALEADRPPAERLAAFQDSRTHAIEAYRAIAASTVGTPPSLDEIAARGLGPPGDPVLNDFDRVCTDVLRTWFRAYAATLAGAGASPEARGVALDELALLATGALPWAAGQGRSAQVEVTLAKAAMIEKGR